MTILRSIDPATLDMVWEGEATAAAACATAIDRARAAGRDWAEAQPEDRIAIARRFAAIIEERGAIVAETIARETGKLLPEASAEVASTVAKVEVSIAALHEHAGTRSRQMPFGTATLRHRSHGVMAVLGLYNFPAHLPNGYIVLALLAGNTVIFKPSEEAPLTGLPMGAAWHDAGLPRDVLQVLPGAGIRVRRSSLAISMVCCSQVRRRQGGTFEGSSSIDRTSSLRWNLAGTIPWSCGRRSPRPSRGWRAIRLSSPRGSGVRARAV